MTHTSRDSSSSSPRPARRAGARAPRWPRSRRRAGPRGRRPARRGGRRAGRRRRWPAARRSRRRTGGWRGCFGRRVTCDAAAEQVGHARGDQRGEGEQVRQPGQRRKSSGTKHGLGRDGEARADVEADDAGRGQAGDIEGDHRRRRRSARAAAEDGQQRGGEQERRADDELGTQLQRVHPQGPLLRSSPRPARRPECCRACVIGRVLGRRPRELSGVVRAPGAPDRAFERASSITSQIAQRPSR